MLEQIHEGHGGAVVPAAVQGGAQKRESIC